ncbi:MAG TPA: 50S ribosomal protein L4 [Actinomycetota bacterium]|nr:50S ribosomal protein L4 [Actinomycetota bacterium]
MRRIPVRTQAGIVLGDVELESSVFEAQVNVPVMHQVVVAQMAARRAGTRDTKTRGEVRGGGKKPYRQKGTGRARQGSIRAPHYAGGGIVWGPHPRDFAVKVPKKMRAAALRSALSDRAKEDRIAVIDELSFESPKTKDAIELMRAVDIEGSVLLVVDGRDQNVERSFRNIPRIHLISVDQLNTYDVLARDWVVFTRAALDKVNTRVQQKRSSEGSSSGETVSTQPAAAPSVTEATTGGETE